MTKQPSGRLLFLEVRNKIGRRAAESRELVERAAALLREAERELATSRIAQAVYQASDSAHLDGNPFRWKPLSMGTDMRQEGGAWHVFPRHIHYRLSAGDRSFGVDSRYVTGCPTGDLALVLGSHDFVISVSSVDDFCDRLAPLVGAWLDGGELPPHNHTGHGCAFLPAPAGAQQ